VNLGLSGRLTKATIRSPLTPLFLLAALAAALVALMTIPREEEPQISVPLVDIMVRADGLKAPDAAELITKPLAGRYDGIPDVSDDPALIVHRFGKGRAIYCSGDLGNAINGFHLAEFFRLVENAARDIAPSPVVIENAPRSMEVVLRSQEQGRRLLLHLINFTGEMTRPIQRVLPIENVRITLRTKGELNKVRTLMRPQTLASRRIGSEQLQFVVPRIEEYEVVVLEK
jgi:hypothetical protein